MNKTKIKNSFRKIEVFLMSMILTLTSVLGSGIAGQLNNGTSNVEAATGSGKVALSKVLNSNKISSIDRPASEGLWKITAGGRHVFCLNSGKSMCTGDTASYKTCYAVNYSDQSIAKALTYFYGKLGGVSSTSTLNFSLTQAYIWACGKGRSKETAVKQAGKNIKSSFDSDDAKAFCKKINNTRAEGTVYYYTITHCVRGKKHDAHQMLFGWKDENPKVEKGNLTKSYSAEGSENIYTNILKRDYDTRAGLAGATFELFCDGQSVGTAKSDENGRVNFTYTRKYKTANLTSDKKNYIKNWDEISTDDQKKYSKMGYYDSYAKAAGVALSEAKNKANAALNTLKNQSHVWSVKETNAPVGHIISANGAAQTKVETSGVKSFSYTFTNTPSTVNLIVNKKSTASDNGVESSLANAVYGVYANGNIYGTDNKTVKFSKNDLIGKIVTDASGTGEIDGLIPGEYYLKELTAPTGYELDTSNHVIDLTGGTKAVNIVTKSLDEKLITGTIKIEKTYDKDKYAEKDAEFEIYNSKDKLVDTITTDDTGIAESKELPYGSYRIHQTKGLEGYRLMTDKILTIDGSESNHEYVTTANDPKEVAALSITKSLMIDDKDTDTYDKRAEQGAEFEIRDADGNVTQTITTDKNGVATSEELKPGTYTVHQTKGTDNYAFIKDFDVTIEDGDKSLHTYEKVNPYNGDKIKLHKAKRKNGKESVEAGAEFTVLDMKYATDIGTTDVSTSELAEKYIDSLDKKAILGTMTTNSSGDASLLLNNFIDKDGFVVIQTKGVEGYLFMDPYYSIKNKATDEDGVKLYEVNAVDEFDNYAQIKIAKKKTINSKNSVPESGAKFEILDMNGEVVDTLTTDAKGEATSIKLSLGIYTIHQVSGSNKHLLIDDEEIVLAKDVKHKVVTYNYTNQEKNIEFKLTKRSSETKKLLNGAVYGIYNKEDDSLVTKLVTGTEKDGIATFSLPYGEYYVKELESPDGYNLDNEKTEFTLDAESVDYNDNGDGSYNVSETDTPIYGKIAFNKTGEILTGYENEAGFSYETSNVKGAVYGLYAKEDIKKDDGTVVWTKGSLIDKKTSDGKGYVSFTRKDADGKDTDEFYMGSYYVKEISVPYGYTLDKEEHEVLLTWDTKAEDLNHIRSDEDIPDIEDPLGNNTPYPNDGIYVLETGEKLNERISDAETITFTWKKAPTGMTTTDVSQNKDGSVVLWKNGTDYTISSQTAGQVIYFNAVSSHMFDSCSDLVEINFDNVDTAGMVNASYMFYKCVSLKTLDISSFNTTSLENVIKMFYGCTSLTTTYANEQKISAADDYKDSNPIFIEALPKTDFMKGDTFKAEDFTFRCTYDDDGEQELNVTDADVSFNPATATTEGKMKIQIAFDSSSQYAKFKTIETEVNVIDPNNMDINANTKKDIKVNLDLTDSLQKYSIHIIKTDEDDNLLEGATFELRAACDIVNSDGKIIFEKGNTIATTISGDSQFGYLEFFGLPSDLYAKDGKGTDMFEVIEVFAPDGYEKSEKVLKFKGELTNQDTPGFVHDVTSEANENNEANTFIHDSDTIVNKKLDYITIKKYWDDNDNRANIRPTSITVTATNKNTKEVKTYTLDASNNWAAVTDIKQEDKGDYTFEEKLVSDKYVQVGTSGWDENTYVVSFTNQLVNAPKDITVQKQWDDNDNQDGIRPKEIIVRLYVDGKATNQTKPLNISNNWTAKFENLATQDEVGGTIEYEIKEDGTDVVNGNEKTGYFVQYDQSTDKESGNETWTITNRHSIETTQKSIKKVWNDSDNKNEIRPSSVTANLLADGEVVDTVTLNADNNWKATSKVLPVLKNGTKIKYEWQEVKTGLITNESEVGYKASYETDKDDTNLTVLTNTHKRTGNPGSIMIKKEIDPSHITDTVGSATFTITLEGTDVYGKKHTYTKDVFFSKNDIKEYVKANSGKKMDVSVTFDDLEYGTYTVSESGSEQFFKLESLTSDSKNATIKDNKVTFEIAPDSYKAGADINGTATFFNDVRRGNLKLKKMDGKENVLEGVTFTLKNSSGKVIEQKTTDQDGLLTFTDLLPDTYTVTEVKTSSGKTLLKKPFEVMIPLSMTENEVEEQSVDTSKAVKVDNTYYFYDETYEITNAANLKLPTTGGNNMIYITLIGGFILLLAGKYIYVKKKN